MRTPLLVALSALGLSCVTVPVEASLSKGSAPAFVENDFAKALAQAREKNLPLFVDAWALWCHTCRSMNAFVFSDPSLGRLGDKYVWLKIDTDRAENAAFVERYPIEAWPTLLVIDPADERVALRWLGSATVDQLERLLQDGERVIAAKKSGDVTGAEALLARADQLYGEGKAEEAIEGYRTALAQAPGRWNRRSRAVESLLFALTTAGRPEECARTALTEGLSLPRSPSHANAIATGLMCALSTPKDVEPRAELISTLEGHVRELMSGAPTGLAADDMSSLYQARAMAREAQGDTSGKLALTAEWMAYLERQASRARTANERSVFDSHLVSAALMLGKPERALPALELSERELPGDYNPPARLALLFKAAKRLDEALAASDRALEKVYGPRKIRVIVDRSEILVERGEIARAIETLESAQVFAATLAPSQRPKGLLARIEQRLAELKPAGAQLKPAAATE